MKRLSFADVLDSRAVVDGVWPQVLENRRYFRRTSLGRKLESPIRVSTSLRLVR
jgi:hypothetical protein